MPRGANAMPMLRLLLLGPVRLETAEGRPVAGVGPKGRALLAYVAAQPDGRAERDRLAGLLWDSDQAQARHALRQMLLVLRRKLGAYATQVLVNDGGAVALKLDAVDIDLRRFEAGIRSGNEAILTSACSLWRGQFCEGLDLGTEGFDEWLAIERARLDESATDAFRQLTQARAVSGASNAAIESARQLVNISPLDDEAHATLIGLYQRRGWVGPARAAYRRCVKLFQRELGERPSDDVEAALRIPIDSGRMPAGPYAPSPPTPASACAPAQLPEAHLGAGTRSATVLLAAAGLAAVMMIGGGRSVLDRFTGASAPARGDVAWVGPNEQTPASDPDAITAVPMSTGPERQAAPVSSAEEIARALELNPRYAHFYPTGC